MPSLRSLTKVAKHNSLHSFTTHSLAELSNLATVPGEDLLTPGVDAPVKGRGQEGKASAPGQLFSPQGQAARSPGGELGSEWGAHLDPPGVQDHPAVAADRGNREEETDEGDQYTQGLFLKQLQQQRQQHNNSHGQDPRARGNSPPGQSGHEPDQARARPPSGDPRTRRDPRTARDTGAAGASPRQDQGRADQDSPDEGATKSSTFLSDLHQAIEPAVRVNANR